MKSVITGVGHYEPQKIVTNDHIVEIYEKRNFLSKTPEEIIKTCKKAGFHERRWVSENEDVRTMATQSVKNLVQRYGGDIIKNLDDIYLGTFSGGYILPSVSAIVAKDIEDMFDITFSGYTADISNACPSGLTALTMADNAIQAGKAKKILVIGSDAMSKLNLGENSLMLFGDAAGAVVVEKDNNFTGYGIQGEYSKTFPQYFSDLYYQNELSANNEDLSSGIFTMNGQNVYHVGVNTVTEMIQEYIEKNNLIINDFNYIIPHQANKRMLDKIGNNLGYDNEKILKTIAENGNTSSASPFLTLSKHQDTLQHGDRILLLSLGAGFNVTLIDVIWGH